MGHTKEDPETLVLEGSPLLMHIGAESTMITFKMNILSINVMKICLRQIFRLMFYL